MAEADDRAGGLLAFGRTAANLVCGAAKTAPLTGQ